MIKIEPMGREYVIAIKSGKEKIKFTFRQLNYFARNKIATASTMYREGKAFLDVGLTCFYNLKYALKKVEGLEDEDGEPYKLEFEIDLDELTDKCVDELLACEISNELLYSARDLGSHIPKKIVHPVDGKPIKGIEVLPPEKVKGGLEKK